MSPGLFGRIFQLIHASEHTCVQPQQHELVGPSSLVSVIGASGSGVLVWGLFSCQALCSLIPVEQHLTTREYLIIIADQVHPYICIVFTDVEGYFQQDNNTSCHWDQIVTMVSRITTT